MKRLGILLLTFILALACGCGKAGTSAEVVGEQLDTTSVDMSKGLIIVNSLAETLSVLDGSGAIHNNVQVTGAAPNSIVHDSPYVYVVNSLSNSIIVLNEKDLTIACEISVGRGRNPMFAAVVRPGVLAVSGFISQTLDIVDVASRKVTASIDLSGTVLPRDVADVSGKSYPQGVAVCNGRIFVALSNLTGHYGGLTAAGPGVVAVFEAATLTSLGTINLYGADPVDMKAVGGKIMVACAGHYEGDITKPQSKGFRGDGTIEIIDAETLNSDKTYQLSAAPFSFTVSDDGILYATNAMGGSIPQINLATGDTGYIGLESAYISSVLSEDDKLYALDFSNDTLFTLDAGGGLIARHTVGDGPIAMLQLSSVTAEGFIVADMNINPVPASIGIEITFDASRSLVTAGDCSYSWDFGDGQTATGRVVRHSYTRKGDYTVTLTISVKPGLQVSSSAVVNIIGTSPFAVSVIDYSPAPGLFYDNPQYNDPNRALGRPYGSTNPYQPDNSSVVTLGGFGGSITLAFDHDVKDNPGNYDFIIFGNAMYTQAPLRWIQPGVVEISQDGLNWYLIPGSLLSPSAVQPAFARVSRHYQEIDRTLSAYQIQTLPSDAIVEGGYLIWGYANLTPVLAPPAGADPDSFYTMPADPRKPGLAAGACGGDSFDIAWAVDPVTGEPAGLDWFRYIRISTAVDADHGNGLGEFRANIDAVADVAVE